MRTAIDARLGWLFAACVLAGCVAPASLAPYTIVGDTVPEVLVSTSGDPSRGRAIIAGRDANCLLCHSVPESGQPLMGDIGPPLSGVGLRLSAAQLRLRIVNAGALNPDTAMPPYYRVSGLRNVAAQYAGKPILSAQQIEDVVAYLQTLH